MTLQEGETCNIILQGLDKTYVDKTVTVKVAVSSTIFAAADVKITLNGVQEDKYEVIVKVIPTGSGKIILSPSPPYHYGDLVTITQECSPNYIFVGWFGDGNNVDDDRVVNITGNMLVNATYSPLIYQINLTQEGNGTVWKTPDGAGINAGSLITLSADETVPGWMFQGWSTDNPKIIIENESSETTYAIINGAGSIKATFTQLQYSIIMVTVGRGEAEFKNSSIITFGSTIELKANNTLEGWSFQSWYTNTTNIIIEDTSNSTTTAKVYGSGTIKAKFVMDNPQENFTLILIPDTQYYSQSYPWIFDNQTQWITSNKAKMNIIYVSNLGDIVNTYTSTSQWLNANHSISILNGYVDYGLLPGNHDGASIGSAGQNLTTYINYFGTPNSYKLFTAGGEDYLIFHFQYNAPDSVLAWANATIAKYPNRRVIVTTHSYLNTDSSRTPEGTVIWQRFVAPHADQVFLVLCGHMHGEAYRMDTINGYTVYQLLSDYQSFENGGNGWLRIIEFNPGEISIRIRTYSPYLNQYQIDEDSEFTLTY